jgi:tetratricopeptide (TPR) repeat protein
METTQKTEDQGQHEHEKLLHDLHQVVAWARQHGKVALAALAAIALALALVKWFVAHKRRSAEEASELLANARNEKELSNVVDDYPSTPSAPFARLQLAKRYYAAGKYDKAEQEYLAVKRDFPQHPHAVTAELGRLHCLEAREQFEPALAGFTAFLDKNPDHYLAAQAALARARCLDGLGRQREAQSVYEDFIAAHPDDAWKSAAEEALAALKRKIAGAGSAPSAGASTAGPTNAIVAGLASGVLPAVEVVPPAPTSSVSRGIQPP